MPAGGLISRVGDVTIGLGVLESPPTPIVGVFINSLPPAGFGSPVTPHFPCGPTNPDHCVSLVMDAAVSIKINKVAPTFTTAMTTCGHAILTGAMGVTIKG